MVPLWADQLLPQLLMEKFDTLPIQCRRIEHMHEGVWFRKNNIWQKDSSEHLDYFSLIRCLYMHRWCLHGPINSHYSFWWSNLILCLYNIDTLNICMKEFGWEKIFLTKWQQWELRQYSLIRCLYMHRWCLCGSINSYHIFWWSNLILCLYNVNTLNICMKQLLMEQFDTLPIQCRHIEHMHEGVYNFCLHIFYWNLLFKTKVCWFEI